MQKNAVAREKRESFIFPNCMGIYKRSNERLIMS